MRKERLAAPPFHQVDVEGNNRIEREAVHIGLPSRVDIAAEIERIRQPRRFERFGEAVIIPERSGDLHISAGLYEQYVREFHEDVDDFRLRVERLKMQILRPYMLGTAKNKGLPDDIGYEEKKALPERHAIEKFLDLALKVKDGRKPLTPDVAQRVLALAKPLLKGHAIDISPEQMTRRDVHLLYQLVWDAEYYTPPDDVSRRQLEVMLEHMSEIEAALSDVQEQGELFAFQQQRHVGEEKFRVLWKQYRRLIKQFATFQEQDQWFSPTYRSSVEKQGGLRQRSEQNRTDYQRFKMGEMQDAERTIMEEYYGLRGYGRYHGLLFNSGMNALTAIMHASHRERMSFKDEYQLEKRIVRGADMYFEVGGVVEEFARTNEYAFDTVPANDTQALIEKIKTVPPPMLVVLEPLANSYEMGTVDMDVVFEALQDQQWIAAVENSIARYAKMQLVIDNTSMGNAAKWLHYDMGRLPRFIQVVGFESMVKYAQDGQDVSQGGYVISFGEYGFEALDMDRRHLGYMPAESVARRLQTTIYGDVSERNMERRSRNTRLIGDMLLRSKNEFGHASLLGEIIYPGSEDHQGAESVDAILKQTGGLLNIGFNLDALVAYRDSYQTGMNVNAHMVRKNYDDAVRTFIEIVMQLAQKHGIDVNMGTSYGFHTTRIARYNYKLPEAKRPKLHDAEWKFREVDYIRVSVGTEHVKDAILLGELLVQANHLVSTAMQQQQLDGLTAAAEERKFLQ